MAQTPSDTNPNGGTAAPGYTNPNATPNNPTGTPGGDYTGNPNYPGYGGHTSNFGWLGLAGLLGLLGLRRPVRDRTDDIRDTRLR
jgi:MYXO-CTERM domain-containing protein